MQHDPPSSLTICELSHFEESQTRVLLMYLSQGLPQASLRGLHIPQRIILEVSCKENAIIYSCWKVSPGCLFYR